MERRTNLGIEKGEAEYALIKEYLRLFNDLKLEMRDYRENLDPKSWLSLLEKIASILQEMIGCVGEIMKTDRREIESLKRVDEWSRKTERNISERRRGFLGKLASRILKEERAVEGLTRKERELAEEALASCYNLINALRKLNSSCHEGIRDYLAVPEQVSDEILEDYKSVKIFSRKLFRHFKVEYKQAVKALKQERRAAAGLENK